MSEYRIALFVLIALLALGAIIIMLYETRILQQKPRKAYYPLAIIFFMGLALLFEKLDHMSLPIPIYALEIIKKVPQPPRLLDS